VNAAAMPKQLIATCNQEPPVESGIQSYYRARYYDQGSGRFLSEDPLRFFGGETDFYSYAEQNPQNLTDPLGLLCRCSYSQSTGHLVCFDIFTGLRYVDANGYAGNGAGKNNPFMNDANSTGPLPRGNYGIGQTVDSKKTGPLTIILTFQNGTTDPFPSNRDKNSMRIHGDSTKHPGEASEGCIVVDKDVRKRINEDCGPGSTLTAGP
jgi:RHS repeat-associated protein